MNPAPQFLKLSPERRALAFGQAAALRGIDPVIMEKDFWVSWLLGVLFAQPALAPHLVFKGGTSLSKVFGVIDRFSEDVDLSVSPSFVGADLQALGEGASRTRRDQAMADTQALCAAKTRDTIAPLLEAALVDLLGTPQAGGAWLHDELDGQTHSPILYFRYPTAIPTGLDYIRRTIKLELGSLTDQQPADWHAVAPWVADAFPAVFSDWQCRVMALDLGRSFWEKATILHAEHHRPPEQPMPDRYARHYSDLARLLAHPDADAFMADFALAARVVAWKTRFFPRGWARYDLAKQGSFRLVPPAERLAALAKDYEAMRPMFLVEPPAFGQVMEQLASAERVLNA